MAVPQLSKDIFNYITTAEKRSLRRVELPKTQTLYKWDKKVSRSEWFDYNAKRFCKTVFYHYLKQASVRKAEDTSVEINAQDTTENYKFVDIPVTFTRQEEGTSPHLDTDMALITMHAILSPKYIEMKIALA